MRSATIGLLFVAASTLSACADENCHMGTHVGAYTGDQAGELTLDLSRVDEDTLVDVTLSGEDAVILASGTLVAVSAREGGCSDLSFDGDLVDADGQVIGGLEGNLTTTGGDGSWWLDDDSEGSWALGSM